MRVKAVKAAARETVNAIVRNHLVHLIDCENNALFRKIYIGYYHTLDSRQKRG